MGKVQDILAELNRDKTDKPKLYKAGDYLSSGSALVNLMMSGYPDGAFCKGGYYHLVGASDSGKSWLTMTTFAEASISKKFKDYRLIHDNPENGTLMDQEAYFGKEMFRRIEPPRGTRKDPIYSFEIDEFYWHLDDAFARKEPFVYVLDSMDVLYADADAKKFKKGKSAARKKAEGKQAEEEAGSYGTAKAKANRAGMRIAYKKLEESGSILIIVSQATANLAFMAKKPTFSGGSALKYFCHGQLWTDKAGDITKKIKGGKTMQQGIYATMTCEKNRHVGRHSKVKLPIYWATGIDDTGSMVDWMLEMGRWKEGKDGIKAGEFADDLGREELIQFIEREELEPKLREAVAVAWEEIRKELVPERKMRYAPKE